MAWRCTCWVSRADEETQFCARYGAHSRSCPVFRESGDPVDREWDRLECLYRELQEKGYPEHVAHSKVYG